MWRRNQQLASRIPGTIFVEPPQPLHAAKVRKESGLVVITPTKLVPFRHPWGLSIFSLLTSRLIRAHAGRRPTIWCTHPIFIDLARRLEGPIIYDRTDDWASMESNQSEAAKVGRMDHDLVRAAAAVIVVSEEMRSQVPGARLIPNGVDYESFAIRAKPADSNRLRIGFAGTLDPWRLDVDLLRGLATDPDIELLLVGPGDANVAATKTGPVDHHLVPGLLQTCDALIAPYRVALEANRTADSLKLYEYFATGLPVLATMTAGYQRFRELVVELPVAGPIRDAIAANRHLAVRRQQVEGDGKCGRRDLERCRRRWGALNGARSLDCIGISPTDGSAGLRIAARCRD